MAQYLPFWPKAAVAVYTAGVANSKGYIYSKALPTNGFKEVVIQIEVDEDFGGNASSYVKAIPQISNNGINWENLTPTGLSIAATGTYPAQDTEKFTTIGAFMRIKIELNNNEGGALNRFSATVIVSGTGRP